MSEEISPLVPEAISGEAYVSTAEANGHVSAPDPAPAPAPPPPPVPNAPGESRDSVREVVETIVFVVVLVLLLRAFVAEAFVIPTGSMAETLLGYQKQVKCPQCHYEFPVNCSSEVDGPPDRRSSVTSCICPNCRLAIDFRDLKDKPLPLTGDRVLVDKSLYDVSEDPQRFHVVVFKYPENPQKNQVLMNYIKRLVGLPGETIVIYGGNLYRSTDLKYEPLPATAENGRLRKGDALFTNDPRAYDLFQKQVDTQFERKFDNQGFEIIRKGVDKIDALKRVVYDNDFQADDLKDKPPRWATAGAWKADNDVHRHLFTHPSGSEVDWIAYRHLLRDSAQRQKFRDAPWPRLITDFSGYNFGNGKFPPKENWVGDLIVEAEVTIDKPAGTFAFDLAKGVDRFQARWDLSSGVCTLIRVTDGKEEVLESAPSSMNHPGTYRLQFANVDERLTVWVDGRLPFSDGKTYKPSKHNGPDKNDLKPARIGASGSVIVNHLKLWRDVYYTTGHASGVNVDPSAADADSGDWRDESESWENPETWEPLRHLTWKTIYVQPGHYLCMGDNSPESSDGRDWGLVPRRLMLGRALTIYYPVGRIRRIR